MIKHQKKIFLVPYICMAITIYVVAVMSALNWNYMPDDGYRYLHVVSNILEGHGVKWNAIDSVPSQSFTSFPWILSLVLSSMVFEDFPLVELAKYFGVISFSLSIIYIFSYIAKYSKNITTSSIFVSMAFITSPVIFFHSVNGMETMLFLLFLTLSVFNFILSLEQKRFLSFAFISFLMTVLVRYEAVIFCGLLCLYLMYIYKGDFQFFLKRFLIFLIIPGLTYVALIYLYFGNILPNSFHVKTATTLISTSGYSYFIENYNTFFLGCSIAFISIYPFSKNPNKLAYLFLFIAMHVQLLLVLRIIPTVGHGGRFMFPYVIPLYLITINITIEAIMERFSHKDFFNKISAVFLIVILIFSTHSLDRKDTLKSLISYSSDRVMDPVIGKSLSNIEIENPSDISIVGGESGAISYFSKFTFVDIWGLHDSFIAKNGLDNNYIFSYKPDMFISFVHSEALIYDEFGKFEGLNMDFINFRIELEKNKDVKGNTAYFSYLVMSDKRFNQMELVRTIDIGGGKMWVFFVDQSSLFSEDISNNIRAIDWDDDKELIVASMRPKKIVSALLRPFNKNNYIRAEVMFDE